MNTDTPYLFRSARLGFRNWGTADLAPMAAINADQEVMRFFPSIQSEAQTADFIQRMQTQFAAKGFCYFAVERLDNEAFIGFIGLSEQTYEADLTPCIDIGWRLKQSEWNQGFATEGAKKCLDYAFSELKLKQVLSVAPKINTASEQVMQKIGMKKLKEFKHPKLKGDPRLEECVLYSIENSAQT